MQPAPIKPIIRFYHLEALDVRVGTVEAVSDVPDSRKLARFVVDFGAHKRTVVACVKVPNGTRAGLAVA